MAHRDFAGRSGSKNNKKKAKKGFNRNTLIVLALVAVLGFGLGLYFLKSKTPAPVVTTNVQPEKPQPSRMLPSLLIRACLLFIHILVNIFSHNIIAYIQTVLMLFTVIIKRSNHDSKTHYSQ